MNRSRLRKEKRKRVLVLSAGGQGSGVQGLYLEIEDSGWSIIAHAFIPYPGLPGLTRTVGEEDPPLTPADLTQLDRRISLLFSECAGMIRKKAPNAQKRPHVIVLNKLTLFRDNGEPGSVDSGRWALELGNPAPLVAQFRVPVITEFSLTSILGNGSGEPPLQAGMVRIAAGSPAFVSVNLGLTSRAVAVDAATTRILFDSDTGPGTCLLNRAAREFGQAEGFDRDGEVAASGRVNRDCLNALCADEWFLLPAPKRAGIGQFTRLYGHAGFQGTPAADKLATLTALTARSVFEFVKREFRDLPSLPGIWLSGGGANNRTLLEYLRVFFNPVPVRTVEEMGVPVEAMVPLALGLTVGAYLDGRPWILDGSMPCSGEIGTWVIP